MARASGTYASEASMRTVTTSFMLVSAVCAMAAAPSGCGGDEGNADEEAVCGPGTIEQDGRCVSLGGGGGVGGASSVGGSGGTPSTLCADNEHVQSNTCVPCPTGATNEAGDDPSGADTVCADACIEVFGIFCSDFEQAYVKASNTEVNDGFGHAIALDGDTLVVAANREDSSATGVDQAQANNDALDSGAVYVFVRDGTAWSQQAYIKASNTDSNDEFGTSVALDGDTLAVGAPFEDSDATSIGGSQANGPTGSGMESGAVYVFVRDDTTSWSQQAYIKASNSENFDGFGASVALDGETLTVGAVGESSAATGINGDQQDNNAPESGAVYVFVRSDITWSQQAYIKASNSENFDGFGASVALAGDTLAVGALYEGGAVGGVHGDASAQASNLAPKSGAVYVFVRSNSNATWSQQAYIKADNPDANDWFGASLALSGDTLAVGAFFEDGMGTGVSLRGGGDGAVGSGAAYVFERVGDTWAQQAYVKASNTTANDHFGFSVAVEGDWLAVGTPGENSDSIGVNGDGVDGDHVNVAANNAGAVFLFARAGTNWSQQAYIKASNTEMGDAFGQSVALAGTTLVATAPGEDSSATGINGDQSNNDLKDDCGAAFVRVIAP